MKQSTNFVTMTMSLRHTATGETNMCSIQVHFLVNKMAEIVERQNLCAVRSGIIWHLYHLCVLPRKPMLSPWSPSRSLKNLLLVISAVVTSAKVAKKRCRSSDTKRNANSLRCHALPCCGVLDLSALNGIKSFDVICN